VSSQDDRLWVDKYEPLSLQDLAVHKRKVDDVRKWLQEAFTEKGHSKHRVGHIFVSPALKVTNAIYAAPTYPHWSCRFREDGNSTCARARHGL
jgi:hypothetical protein